VLQQNNGLLYGSRVIISPPTTTNIRKGHEGYNNDV